MSRQNRSGRPNLIVIVAVFSWILGVLCAPTVWEIVNSIRLSMTAR